MSHDQVLITEEALAALPTFRCHKLVKAAVIADCSTAPTPVDLPGGFRMLQLVGAEAVEVSHAWFEKHQPKPGGYLVSYADGYFSYSPAEAFEAGYRAVDGLRFGEAIEGMKRGLKARRRLWKDDHFVVLVPGTPEVQPREGTPYHRALVKPDSGCPTIAIRSHFDFYTPNGGMQPGWLPNTTDMLSMDWILR